MKERQVSCPASGLGCVHTWFVQVTITGLYDRSKKDKTRSLFSREQSLMSQKVGKHNRPRLE